MSCGLEIAEPWVFLAEEGGYIQANAGSQLENQDDFRARSWKDLDGKNKELEETACGCSGC
jgi:hypothetical protein